MQEETAGRPSVSVCLLAYAHAAQIHNSLDDLLAQTLTDFELIINDDSVHDGRMEAVCRAYEQKDPRIRYFRNARNRGRIGNYNAAVARARADTIAIVHDGDRYRPDLLAKWVAALETYPTAAFVFNALEAIDWNGARLRTYHHDYPPLIRGHDLLQEMLGRSDSPVFGMTMFRRRSIDLVGPFDGGFDIIGDVDMWMRMALHFDVAYVGEPLIGILPREKDHDTTLRMWETLSQNEAIHRVNAERLYKDHPKVLQAAVARIDRMFESILIRQLLSCVRHRSSRQLQEGLAYARTRRRVAPRLMALALAPAARLISRG